jgi:hypothetical protein
MNQPTVIIQLSVEKFTMVIGVEKMKAGQLYITAPFHRLPNQITEYLFSLRFIMGGSYF